MSTNQDLYFFGGGGAEHPTTVFLLCSSPDDSQRHWGQDHRELRSGTYGVNFPDTLIQVAPRQERARPFKEVKR